MQYWCKAPYAPKWILTTKCMLIYGSITQLLWLLGCWQVTANCSYAGELWSSYLVRATWCNFRQIQTAEPSIDTMNKKKKIVKLLTWFYRLIAKRPPILLLEILRITSKPALVVATDPKGKSVIHKQPPVGVDGSVSIGVIISQNLLLSQS